MKKVCYTLMALMSLSLYSCEGDSKVDPKEDNDPKGNMHLDLFLTVQGTSATGSYVASVFDPSNSDQTVNVLGSGIEVSGGKLSTNNIQKGKYYYQILSSKDGLEKVQLVNNKAVSVASCPFGTNSFSGGLGFTAAHEWLDDNILLLTKYSPSTKKIIWSKINTVDMTLITEGNFEIKGINDFVKFSTTGHLRYRKSDNTLFLFTSRYLKGTEEIEHPMTGDMYVPDINTSLVVVAIDPTNMKLKQVTEATHVQGLRYHSTGDILEERAYIDFNNDIYISCLKKGSNTASAITRVKSTELKADAEYCVDNFGANADILITRYLKPGKAIFYIRDIDKSGATSTGVAFNSYYAIYDNVAKTFTPVKFDGQDLPWSSGRFANRLCKDGDKMYIGLNTDTGNDYDTDGTHVSYIQAQAYVYNINTDVVTKGFAIDAKYEFMRMNAVEN